MKNRIPVLGLLLTALLLFAASAAEAAGPYQFFSVTPCRIVDTRNPAGPTGGPALAAQTVRNFPIRGQCGVPVTAQAVVLNVTIVSPVEGGFLTLYPYNTARPNVSTLNWAPGEPALANGALVPLASDPTFQLSVYAGMPSLTSTAHLLLDVTGYFQ